MDVTLPPTTRQLTLEPATPEALAPFGQILGDRPGLDYKLTEFYGASIRLAKPIAFRCDGEPQFSLARMQPRPGQVRYMERHHHHTQGFLSLGGRPFVMVLAPPTDGPLPDLDQVRAFRFDGSFGFFLAIGTWHEFPFVIVPDTDLIVVLSAQTNADLKRRDPDSEEAEGPDLEKRDLVARTGVQFVVDLA